MAYMLFFGCACLIGRKGSAGENWGFNVAFEKGASIFGEFCKLLKIPRIKYIAYFGGRRRVLTFN